MDFAILSDTSTGITREKLPIPIARANISFDDEEFIEGDLDFEYMVSRLNRGEYAKTSLPSIAEYKQVYEEALKISNKILCIHVSDRLSGTLNASRVVAMDYKDQATIHIFDTKGISYAAGYFVKLAYDLREQGFSMEETITKLEQALNKIRLSIFIKDVDYLKRSGRVNLAQYAVLKTFKLHPLLKLDDGLLVSEGFGMGKKHGYKTIAKRIKNEVPKYSQPSLILGYSDNPEDIEYLKSFLDPEVFEEVVIIRISPTLLAHTGPKAIGLGIVEQNSYYY